MKFQVENANGSRVFFTSEGDLYEFAVTASDVPFAGTVTDLTVDQHSGESADVISEGGKGGVLGASEDGSYVYFVARGVLAEGATAGAANIYVLHEAGGVWTTKFVASLSDADQSDWSYQPKVQTARVSPNGRFVAFMSVASLTGYDNRDANTGKPDSEVLCVRRVDGTFGVWVVRSDRSKPDRRARASPRATPVSDTEAFYQPRYLSNEGRLFFDSLSPLVPQDINGQEDVYEFEPNEVGGCRLAAGCIDLISGGTGPEGSSFLDASATGDDVFFRTNDQLVRQDFDTQFDVYDAHVCSTEAPCYAAPPVSLPACTTADSCRAAPSPQPAIFGAPPSATFSGAGNVTPSTPTVVKTKAKTKKKAKAKAKKKPREEDGRRRQGSQVDMPRRGGSNETRTIDWRVDRGRVVGGCGARVRRPVLECRLAYGAVEPPARWQR